MTCVALIETGDIGPLVAEMSEEAKSVWQNPTTWTSILGILLTVCMLIGGFLASQLYTIHDTLQTILISTSADAARKTEQISTLREELTKLETKINTDEANQTAYNFDMKGALIRVQAAQAAEKK